LSLAAVPAALAQPFDFETGPPLPLRLIREPPAPPAPAAAAPEELLLLVDVNRQRFGEPAVVLRAQGRLYAAREHLARWRLRVPESVPLIHQGIEYYPIDELPDAHWELDASRQALSLTAGPEAFTGTVATAPGATASNPILPQPGGFLNYGVSAAHNEAETRRSGVFEAGFFGGLGVLTSSHLATELEDSSSWVRLDTTFTRDDPARLTTWRLGDAVTRAGAWGLPVRFGGIQYGTKFETQPGFVQYPLVNALGQATLPSTVDVFVNNALVTRRSVPPGPFAVTDIPVVTGGGEVRMVVRDILGREVVFTQPFYGSTALLRQGISDYSFEAGALREAFGLESGEYGEALAVGTFRHGFTDSFTAEARGEATESSTTAGGALAARLGTFGVASASLAASDGEDGGGTLVGAGFERSGTLLSFGARTLAATEEFRQAGLLEGELPRRRQSIANIGVNLGAVGSLSLTRASQSFYDREDVGVTTLSYSVPVARLAHFGLTAVRTSGALGGSSVFATLAIPLDPLTSATLGVERTSPRGGGESETVASASLQRSLPVGEGWGYAVRARDEDLYGNVALRTGIGTYALEAARVADGDTSTRLSAAGGVGIIGGHAFLSREITDSFGVVRVADYPNVRVLQDNQVVGRTDGEGYAVLPRMRAYDRNPVSVDPRDLPLDASIGALSLYASPYFRSGVLIDFPVRRVRAATLRVVLENGADLPSGALARVEGAAETFPVALGGQAYLEGLERQNRIVFTWRGQRCAIDVSYPPVDDPLPDLGVFLCKGVKP
jgi:outer membrane usher protein